MLLRKLAMRSAFMGWVIAALLLASIPSSQAVQTLLFSSIGSSGCGTAINTSFLYANKLVASRSATINVINVAIGTGSQTNFSTSRYYIMANDPTGGSSSNGAPSTVLATFTPDVITGTGANTIAKYVGSYLVSSGTKFWVVAAQRPSDFPMCFWNPTSTSSMTSSGVAVDTSTSGVTTSWLRAYSNVGTTPVGASWTVLADNTAFQFSLENNTPTPVTASLATQSGALSTTYRAVTPLRVSVDTPSRVTYFANGKVIAGCRNVLSSSGIATCNWKPSIHGLYRLYANANPISTSYSATLTSVISVGVAARINRR